MQRPKIKGTPKVGIIIKRARLKKGFTRKQAAKAVKLSEAYFGHIERGSLVTISSGLLSRLKTNIGPMNGLLKLLPKHNKKVSEINKYYRSK